MRLTGIKQLAGEVIHISPFLVQLGSAPPHHTTSRYDTLHVCMLQCGVTCELGQIKSFHKIKQSLCSYFSICI